MYTTQHFHSVRKLNFTHFSVTFNIQLPSFKKKIMCTVAAAFLTLLLRFFTGNEVN